MHLESPVIRVRAPRRTQSVRLAFDHYVATEAGWDGGNISISVNGGPYQIIPATAFLFNAYNTTINPPEAGNTNPLAGQPGWSGTDGGQVFGSWGESQVDLTALGVQAGDRIRLKFDFGMDGCTGVDGWYVDDIEITACRTRGSDDDNDDNDVTATGSARRS
jgi:bacillopeptidase F (M6 metalloprotease family)